ncbi:MAG: type IV pilin protein [Tepidimonas sp.]|uniref:type IV pilin protein n=1 Tax=Tepidimonas sp. TaxID=2002775 RepID=UPI0040552A99
MRTRGFSLIELMVAVAVIGILAAVAYPSYLQFVLRTHRNAAQACLMELAQWMERFYSSNMTYADATLPNTSCRRDLNTRYIFSFVDAPTATTFTIQAQPVGPQAGDRCGTLTIDASGTRTPSTRGCWN